MKIFAIRDESGERDKDLAYLLYYEIDKQFYIELPDGADPWETPLLLSSFVERGEHTVGAYWSKVWVQQRIIPPDRQNIGQVLRDNGLREYDEYGLLVLAMGRCAQDDCYLVPLAEGDLPQQVTDRFARHVTDVLSLGGHDLLVFFCDGAVKRCSLRERLQANRRFGVLLGNEGLFACVRVQTGGYGVAWDVNLTVGCEELYETGTSVPLAAEDFGNFVARRTVTSVEAAELLGCSRQNVDDLVRRGKLHPVKSGPKTTLFLASEVCRRTWR